MESHVPFMRNAGAKSQVVRLAGLRGGHCALNQEAERSLVNVVLVEPEIPPNTGNIARLCAATRTQLHLIEPLGFKLDDTRLKRAGMDYWQHVEWQRWANWRAFEQQLRSDATLWFVESDGPRRYTDVAYAAEDYLVFGRETAGLPPSFLVSNPEHWLRIPLFNAQARSLNLSNCVALVLFEALRQQGFAAELFRHDKS